MFELGSLVNVYATITPEQEHRATGETIPAVQEWVNARVTAHSEYEGQTWYEVEVLDYPLTGQKIGGFTETPVALYDIEHATIVEAKVYVKIGYRGDWWEDHAISWNGSSFSNAVDLALVNAYKENLKEEHVQMLLEAAETLRQGRTWTSEDGKVRFTMMWNAKYPHPFY
jgi:hypothetical protein